MRWKIAEAKQKFSEVVRQAAHEPQLIFNRESLVAAVIDPETFEAFQSWRAQKQARTVAEVFAELRQIATAEGYSLETPPRFDRRSAISDFLDGVSD